MENVDTRVSLGLHPENVTKIEGYGPDTADAVASVKSALQAAYTGLSAVHNARDAAKTNPTWTLAQQIIATADFGWKTFERFAPAFDRARAELKSNIDAIEKELSAPVVSKAALPLSTEIRGHVKAMPATKRQDFLMKAIREGDDLTASAILGVPLYLSGLDDAECGRYTRLYHKSTSPAKAKRLAVMRSGLEMLDCVETLPKEMDKAIGASPEKVNNLRAAKAAAEKVFILQDAAHAAACAALNI